VKHSGLFVVTQVVVVVVVVVVVPYDSAKSYRSFLWKFIRARKKSCK